MGCVAFDWFPIPLPFLVGPAHFGREAQSMPPKGGKKSALQVLAAQAPKPNSGKQQNHQGVLSTPQTEGSNNKTSVGFVPPGACPPSRDRRNAFVNEFEPHFHVPRRLQQVPTPLVEAVNDFHFAMMNDKPRNEFYWELLRRNVGPDTGVLEIGAGSGLLSMMAAKLGAKWVVAVEGSPDMAELAVRNIEANGLQDRVTVLCMMSTDLDLGDLPDRPDVLVSEILGTLLLGESAHDYIEDVRKRILKPTTRVIPQHGVQYAVPIQCETLQSITAVDKWDILNLSHINALKDTVSTVFTKKYGFRLSSVPFTKLAPPIPVVTIDFANNRGRRDVRRNQRFEVVPSESGVCHAMLLYWEVQDDGLVMSTDPDRTRDNFPRDMQWGQALQLIDPEPNSPLPGVLEVTRGKAFDLRCRSSDDGVLLQFSVFSSNASRPPAVTPTDGNTVVSADPDVDPDAAKDESPLQADDIEGEV